MKIDFKADDLATIEEKTKQNEEAVKVSTSRNAVDVDGKSLDGENYSLEPGFFMIFPCLHNGLPILQTTKHMCRAGARLWLTTGRDSTSNLG